jgi:hypothetical protein
MVSDYGQYEAALRVNLKDKYFPVVEIGIGKADGTDESTQINYKTTAPYGRIGCDFNLLRNKHDIYRLYGGVRYALTYFKYDLKGPDIQDPIWGGTTPYEVNGVKCNYHWAEFVFGADAMYAGIVIDTDNFLTKTGVRTFDAASYLRRSGADVVRVRKMFRSDMYTYRQLAEGVINSEIYMEHFAISTVDPKESDAPTVVAAKVANDLLNIEGIRASFVTTEKDGTVYMSARSVDDVNVQIIMEKMGGGGHANIAGAQFTNSTNELVLIQLKTLLDEMYREGDI